ncbi:MBL fold metallo-hydrolase [Camelliibacillus cellulosilyticus]|uniref:MBL fold metallo-hydrolase n=1 Tax=Camelliibacillus cellulosilyticus TaxID=2174486 RepID=A0ABV9GJX6_9BACL
MTVEKMTTEQMAEKLINGERLFILDVRNTDEFDDWKIEGRSVQVINVPYFNLIDDVSGVVHQLPKDEPILVVCAKGGSSEFIAEQLIRAGVEHVYSLEGGMKAWSDYLRPVKLADLGSSGAIYQFVRLGKGCLSYFIMSDGEAVIIDASRMIENYLAFAKAHGVKIKAIIDTHLHADHISGGRRLAELSMGSYYLPPQDADDVAFHYEPLLDEMTIQVGKTKMNVLYSPGHTQGSTSLVVDDKFFLTGDILFIASIGRLDLAGQAMELASGLRETLYQRYQGLAKNLIVLPAHFAKADELNENGSVSAKLGDLYQQNAGLNVKDQTAFLKMVTEQLPPQPNAYREIRQINKGVMTADEEKQREMEIGPNRCAVD